MSKKHVRYDEDCKRARADLYHNGKTQPSLCKKSGVSASALSGWSRRCPSVKLLTVSYAPALA